MVLLPSARAPFSGKASSALFNVRWLLRRAVIRPALRFLQGKSQCSEETAHVSRMVADPELFSDHLSNPLARPYIPSKPVRLGSPSQKLGQFGALLLTQARWCSGRRLVPQTFHALFSEAPHPLAYGPFFGYPQGVGYLCLFPEPRSLSSKARRRLPARQSLASWLDSVFSTIEFIVPAPLAFYVEISKLSSTSAW
jgi:hypothetical protein